MKMNPRKKIYKNKKYKMSSFIDDMNVYFSVHGDEYHYKVIEFTKSIMNKFEDDKTLKDFLVEHNISISDFLSEFLPLSDYKYKKFGDEKLSNDDLEEILNFLIVKGDIEKLEIEGHIENHSDNEEDDNFIPDEYAVKYLKKTYDVDLKIGEPFSYESFYEEKIPIEQLMLNVCLN